MNSGAHVVLSSTDAKADRRFFRSILKFPHVSTRKGWLILALPPAELAVHPADEYGSHEPCLLCHDLKAKIRLLKQRRVKCSNPVEQGWGTIATVTLLGGSKLRLYQPKHQLANS